MLRVAFTRVSSADGNKFWTTLAMFDTVVLTLCVAESLITEFQTPKFGAKKNTRRYKSEVLTSLVFYARLKQVLPLFKR